MMDYDGGNDEKADDSSVGRIATAACSSKHQARPPIDHIKTILEEVFTNHTYPVKHKLRECDMMKNFMILGFLPQGMELDEVPGRSDTMPFTGVDAVMTVYDGCPQ
jgi:hypothetical protein